VGPDIQDAVPLQPLGQEFSGQGQWARLGGRFSCPLPGAGGGWGPGGQLSRSRRGGRSARPGQASWVRALRGRSALSRGGGLSFAPSVELVGPARQRRGRHHGPFPVAGRSSSCHDPLVGSGALAPRATGVARRNGLMILAGGPSTPVPKALPCVGLSGDGPLPACFAIPPGQREIRTQRFSKPLLAPPVECWPCSAGLARFRGLH